MTGLIRLAIIEDHPTISEGLIALLEDEQDMEVVGTASDAASGLRLVRGAHPDVVLCDIQLGAGPQGLDILEAHATAARFVMFTAYTLPAFYARAIEGDARGFIAKTSAVRDVVKAVRTVAAGGRVYPPEALRVARAAPRAPTARELDVLGLVAAGRTNAQVAAELGIRERTVESQLARMFDRYGVSTRTGLVDLARRQGWIVS